MADNTAPSVFFPGIDVSYEWGTVTVDTRVRYLSTDGQTWEEGIMNTQMIDKVSEELVHHFKTMPFLEFANEEHLRERVCVIVDMAVSRLMDDAWKADSTQVPVRRINLTLNRPATGGDNFEGERQRAEREAAALHSSISNIVRRFSRQLIGNSPVDRLSDDIEQIQEIVRSKASGWLLARIRSRALNLVTSTSTTLPDSIRRTLSGTPTLVAPGADDLVIDIFTGDPPPLPSFQEDTT